MDQWQTIENELGALHKVLGTTPADVLTLPGPVAGLLRQLIQKGPMKTVDVAQELGCPEETAMRIMDILVDKGFVSCEACPTEQSTVYSIYYARMRRRSLPAGLE